MKRCAINLIDMGATYQPGILVLSSRQYHEWWSMGATLIVDDLELAPVLSGTHLPTSGAWKAQLAKQHEKVGRSVGMTSTGNQTRVARMVAQRFTHYDTA